VAIQSKFFVCTLGTIEARMGRKKRFKVGLLKWAMNMAGESHTQRMPARMT
jgi:hypothetical protein